MSETPGTYQPNADEIQKANARRVGWQAREADLTTAARHAELTPEASAAYAARIVNEVPVTGAVYPRLATLEARCAELERIIADLRMRLQHVERRSNPPRNGQRE